MRSIDINSDVGESFGAYAVGDDEAVMQMVTSVNIACGMHAGDPMVMQRSVRMAKACGVFVGAHPGYPDLQGFGRRAMGLSPAETEAYVRYQIGALDAICKSERVQLHHVKPHGALYNLAAVDRIVADAICRAIRSVNESLILLGLSGSEMISAAKRQGLPYACEAFADRAYFSDGTLAPRSMEGAVIHDGHAAAARVVRLVESGTVESITGETIRLEADSVCVHGDNPAAVAMIGRLREALARENITAAGFGKKA